MNGEHVRRSEDVAAYMLGALEPERVVEFERHVEGCERCRSEIRWLAAAVDTLPESVERHEPPPGLRERLMDEVGEDAHAAAQAPKAKAGGRLPAWLRGAGRYGWRPLAGLAAVALLAVAFGGYEVGNGGGGSGEKGTIVAGNAPGVVAEVERSGDSAELRLANVRQLPEDRVLEAWVQREGEVEPVRALFVPDRAGNASTMIADMTGVEVVMVTKEPSGGSPAPTSAPVATVPIPKS